MSPSVALFLWFILVVGLLRFDPAKEVDTSAALWIPLTWMFIVASRLPSQWFGYTARATASILEEGIAFDRNIFIAMMVISIFILISRSFNWVQFFTKNIALTIFFAFALLSVLWSDFPSVAIKRWFRDFGIYLAILVALSDVHPRQAICTVIRRLLYILIPLSVLLIKYFPAMSRQYDFWTGVVSYTGAASSKNTLGVLCLVSGLFFFWDTLGRWSSRKVQITKRIILVNLFFLAMTLWVLQKSSSATSQACLALGCLVIMAARTRDEGLRGYLKVLIPSAISLYGILAFGLGFDLNAIAAQFFGRDPTLTDRTKIWKVVLSVDTNPLLGTGYESFWLGSRLQKVWQVFPGINEAHNGYLQMYLQLGFIGLLILCWVLMSFYRSIWRRHDALSGLAPLSLALWTVLAFYNVTEAAFQGGVLWLTLLPGVLILHQDEVESTQNFSRIRRPTKVTRQKSAVTISPRVTGKISKSSEAM
jgi:exopolysaccharide production protein ExoQ